MVYDSAVRHSVLFGGISWNGVYTNDTWAWDGGTWTPLHNGGPEPRANHAMAYDSRRGRIVLFGGAGNRGVLGDTWEWDGVQWIERLQAIGPHRRVDHAMTFDSQRGVVVMFGGLGHIGTSPTLVGLNDTLEYNGFGWGTVSLAGPSARFAHSMAYDARRGRTVLFGGRGGLFSPWSVDTWEWDGSTWVQSIVSHPMSSEHVMVFDSRRDRCILYSGFDLRTSEWDGTAWLVSSSSIMDRIGAFAACYDAERGRMVLAGGTRYPNTTATAAQTWERRGDLDRLAFAYGTGCDTAPFLQLDPVPTAPPVLNGNASVQLTGIQSSMAFVGIGLSRYYFGPFRLPLRLDQFGVTGCRLLTSAELPAEPVVFQGPGTATYGVRLPNDPALAGFTCYLQGWALDPNRNPAQVVVSNGVEWGFGF